MYAETLKFPPCVGHPRPCRFVAPLFLAPFIALALSAQLAWGQSAATPRKGPAKSGEKSDNRANEADTELRRRLDVAQAAQRSGDATAVAQTNERLIALALREIAQLRLLESSYPQAIELYRRSLDFEDFPDTRVDLAIAELQRGHPDEALADSDKALIANPESARAFGVRGRAWIDKQDYGKAAQAFARAVLQSIRKLTKHARTLPA